MIEETAVGPLPLARSRVSARRRHPRHHGRAFMGQIGKLGAVAVIRSGLNYFLAREMKEEQEAVRNQPV